MRNGTATAAAIVPNAFGKTGTTSDHRDAWFVGYTPELVTAVWLASPRRDRRGIVRYRPMPGATGGNAAAPIWARFMWSATAIQREANRRKGVMPWQISLPEPEPYEGRRAADKRGTTTIDRPGSVGGGPLAEAPPRAGGDHNTVLAGHRSMVPSSRPAASVAVSEEGGGQVRICADSGELATMWCPVNIEVPLQPDTTPRHYCTVHRPPPGEH